MKATKPCLWTYNYDFEFELGGQHKILLHERELAPWFYLNRSSNLLLPFLDSNDALISYSGVDHSLTKFLCDTLSITPRLHELRVFGSESNSVLSDLNAKISQLNYLKGYQLMPWGWSPKANMLMKHLGGNHQDQHSLDRIREVNSKAFSTQLREQLPGTYQIPAKVLERGTLEPTELEANILSFYAEHGAFFVKNFFGTSGRQSDFYRSAAFSPRRLRRWNHWISETGGILLEKAVQIQQEFSLQLTIDTNGTIRPIVLTEMFSASNGSYLGNIIHRNNEIPQWLLDDILPLLSQISEKGYHGPVGIDFIRTDSGETKLLEINCRITMGRVAYEWIQKLPHSSIGLFANFFVPGDRFPTYNSFFELANNLSKAYNCSFLPINFVPSKQNSNSLISICVGANTKDAALALIDEIKPSTFDRVKK